MVALCLGAAAVLALSVLRPGAGHGREVGVAARPIGAGEVIAAEDLAARELPPGALPAEGLAGCAVVGSRGAIRLVGGTGVSCSLTSAARGVDLGDGERLVQVPVEVGAQLAEPGAHVDVIGEVVVQGADGAAGAGEFQQAPSTDVLCRNARVVLSTTESDDSRWTAGRKVTLITLAVPAANANLIVSAATNGALGVVLSP